MSNYYTDALERQYDYAERCAAEQIERERAEQAAAFNQHSNCETCGKPIPLSEAGALCEGCEEYAEMERNAADQSEYERLGKGGH